MGIELNPLDPEEGGGPVCVGPLHLRSQVGFTKTNHYPLKIFSFPILYYVMINVLFLFLGLNYITLFIMAIPDLPGFITWFV